MKARDFPNILDFIDDVSECFVYLLMEGIQDKYGASVMEAKVFVESCKMNALEKVLERKNDRRTA